MGSCTSSKRAHKNASSRQTNPDIKGRREEEPKSLNQRHWLISAAPSALPGGPQATVSPRGEMRIHPPAHPRATFGFTPSRQHPFSIQHLFSSAVRWEKKSTSRSPPRLSSFCSAAQTRTKKWWPGRHFKAKAFLMTEVRDNLWPPHRGNNNCWQGWKKCSHCEHKQTGRSSWCQMWLRSV